LTNLTGINAGENLKNAGVLRGFHSHVKQYVLGCRQLYLSVTVAAKLPLKLPAVQDALEWMKTEKAAENARARARVAEVVANLMHIENIILTAHVRELYKGLKMVEVATKLNTDKMAVSYLIVRAAKRTKRSSRVR